MSQERFVNALKSSLCISQYQIIMPVLAGVVNTPRRLGRANLNEKSWHKVGLYANVYGICIFLVDD